MVRRAVDAFLNGDAALAREVILDDHRVDALYVQMFADLLQGMRADPLCIERSSHLIIVIKNWERIADQATNMAEEVLYILEGVNVKHRSPLRSTRGLRVSRAPGSQRSYTVVTAEATPGHTPPSGLPH